MDDIVNVSKTNETKVVTNLRNQGYNERNFATSVDTVMFEHRVL